MNAPAKEAFATLGHELTMTRALLDGAQALIESSEYTVGDDSLLHAQKLVVGCLDRLETTWTTIDEATYGKDADVNTVCFILMGELTLTRAMLDGAHELIGTCEHSDTCVALAHARTLSEACNARLKEAYNNIDRASVAASAQGAT